MIGLGAYPSASRRPSNRGVGKRDISADFSSGSYQVAKTQFYYDESPGGSYDFTLLQNGSDAVNVPSPFNGRIVDAHAGCTVGDTECGGRYGNYLEVEDLDTGVRAFIAHLGSAYVQEGDVVRQGQAIGKQGSTGRSSGPHLHVEWSDSNGNRIIDRTLTEPLMNDYLSFIERGSFLPSEAGLAPTAQASTTALGGGLPELRNDGSSSLPSTSSGVPSSNFNGVQLRPREQYV
ncbi:MAG: M23 family metallopeptidase, partial [Cyanobacteria bacterium J06626_6]